MRKITDPRVETFQQVQKYEVGSNRISASKLFEIGQALQTPVSWFFEGLDLKETGLTDEAGSQVHAFLRSTSGLDLAEAYLAVPSAEQRRQLLDLMRSMAS